MKFVALSLSGAFMVESEPQADSRGFFARTFCRREFAERGMNPNICQSSVAFNRRRGTVRGMHFQFPPAAESKLVRVTSGAVLDVIVDLRPESSTFLKYEAIELTADNSRAVYVPERFAHGYQTLLDDTEASYEIGEFYEPSLAAGFNAFDRDLELPWPFAATEISTKDASCPPLSDMLRTIRERMGPGTTEHPSGSGVSEPMMEGRVK